MCCMVCYNFSPFSNEICLIMVVCMVIEHPVFYMKANSCLECDLVSSDEFCHSDHSLVSAIAI